MGRLDFLAKREYWIDKDGDKVLIRQGKFNWDKSIEIRRPWFKVTDLDELFKVFPAMEDYLGTKSLKKRFKDNNGFVHVYEFRLPHEKILNFE